MSYRIRYTGRTRQVLRTMPGRFRQRVRRVIEALADNPRPVEAKERRDEPEAYQIRLNHWRIIYRVDDDAQVVSILLIKYKNGPIK